MIIYDWLDCPMRVATLVVALPLEVVASRWVISQETLHVTYTLLHPGWAADYPSL